MFEDLMHEKQINIAQLSVVSGIGYNYVFKIVRNRTDIERCGLETAKKISDALGMDLNQLYDYKENYFQKRIYYQDQSKWDYHMYGELNAELNKLFLVGIEYHFLPSPYISRNIESCRHFDNIIRCIRYDKLSTETKCIMVAILNQQNILNEFIKEYSNLAGLINQKPLSYTLFLAKEPYDIFQSYREMNIAY